MAELSVQGGCRVSHSMPGALCCGSGERAASDLIRLPGGAGNPAGAFLSGRVAPDRVLPPAGSRVQRPGAGRDDASRPRRRIPRAGVACLIDHASRQAAALDHKVSPTVLNGTRAGPGRPARSHKHAAAPSAHPRLSTVTGPEGLANPHPTGKHPLPKPAVSAAASPRRGPRRPQARDSRQPQRPPGSTTCGTRPDLVAVR
jgi:hypothetical protein